MSDQAGKESQFMLSYSELGSDSPIGSDQESGRDITSLKDQFDSKCGIMPTLMEINMINKNMIL